MLRKILFTSLSVLSFISSANAITPAEIVAEIAGSPAIEALKATNDAELKNEASQNFLSGPEVEFEHLWNRNGVTKWSLGVKQNFEWPGVYSVRKSKLDLINSASRASEEAVIQDLKYQATTLLVKIAYIQQRIDIYKSMIADMSQLSQYIDTALEHGLVTILDKKKAGIELTGLYIEYDKLNAEKRLLIADLEEIAGRSFPADDIDWLAMPSGLELGTLESYLEEIEDADKSLVVFRRQTEIAQKEIKETEMSLLPGFGVGFLHEKEVEGHFNGFSVSVNLPTWGIAAKKNAAALKVTASEMDLAVRKNATRTRILNEYNTAVNLRENINRLRTNGMDGTYMALLKEARLGGEISMLDYLREQGYYRSASMSLLDIEEQYTLLLTSLNRYRK